MTITYLARHTKVHGKIVRPINLRCLKLAKAIERHKMNAQNL